MNGLQIVVLTFVGCALLLIGIAVPLCLRRVGPNRFYGFRTPKNLADESIWYETNAVCGQWLVVTGIVTLLVVGAGWFANLGEAELSIAGTAAVVAGTLFCTVHPFVVQRRMLDEREFDNDTGD